MSPNYAAEISTNPEKGVELDVFIREVRGGCWQFGERGFGRERQGARKRGRKRERQEQQRDRAGGGGRGGERERGREGEGGDRDARMATNWAAACNRRYRHSSLPGLQAGCICVCIVGKPRAALFSSWHNQKLLTAHQSSSGEAVLSPAATV